MLTLLRDAFRGFLANEAPVRAAALAYYTVFALPPLLVLLLMAAGALWDPADVQRAMAAQFASLIGPDGAETLEGMLRAADRAGASSFWRAALSAGGLIFAATGAFLQLQGALNRAWGVMPDPASGGVRNFIMKRLLSLGMVLGLGFLTAVSLALSAAIGFMSERVGAGFPEVLLQAAHFTVSLGVLSVLFAAIYRVLPDARITWQDVRVGAVVTALLFVAGKLAIGAYLGRSNPGAAFGAAAALAVMLVWVYYAGTIVLFGAELTRAWARRQGRDIVPEKGAARAGARVEGNAPQFTPSGGATAMNGNGPFHRRGGSEPELYPHDRGSGRFRDGASVGELFKELGADTTHLLRQEINLAKAELRDSAAHIARGIGRLGVAAALAVPGLLAFTAFLIIALGGFMNNYWASALIVSLVLLGATALVARKGMAELGKGSLVPRETVGTLREDVEWAKQESQAFKRALGAPQTHAVRREHGIERGNDRNERHVHG